MRLLTKERELWEEERGVRSQTWRKQKGQYRDEVMGLVEECRF